MDCEDEVFCPEFGDVALYALWPCPITPLGSKALTLQPADGDVSLLPTTGFAAPKGSAVAARCWQQLPLIDLPPLAREFFTFTLDDDDDGPDKFAG